MEAENRQWGRQPFGLVPCALEASFLPSWGLAGTVAGGPVQRWVSGGHGIKHSARVKEDSSLAGVTNRVPGPWREAGGSLLSLDWLGKGWTTMWQMLAVATTSKLFPAIPAYHLVPQLLGK